MAKAVLHCVSAIYYYKESFLYLDNKTTVWLGD